MWRNWPTPGAAPRETDKAQRELSDAYAELTDGEAGTPTAFREYEGRQGQRQTKLSDARRKLNDARRGDRRY